MLSTQNWNKIGKDIRKAVEDSVNTGNFSNLGYVVTDTLGDVFSGRNKQYLDGTFVEDKPKENVFNNMNNNVSEQKFAEFNPQVWNSRNYGMTKNVMSSKALKPFFQKKGSISSVLYMVFGSIGLGVSGLTFALYGGISMLISAGVSKGAMTFLILLMLSFFGMIELGVFQRKRLKRAQRYVEICNGQSYINLSDLASQYGKNDGFVIKDVKNMLSKGFFPQGHLDAKETCFMLDDNTYREYLELEKKRRMIDMQQVEKTQSQREMSVYASEEKPGLDLLLETGHRFVYRVRQIGNNIQNRDMLKKLGELETTLNQIFGRIEQKPEQMSKLEKFIDYYLPTTLKLVETYAEFETVLSPGEDVLSAKKEIELTMDTINSAFTDLLNKLFLDDVYDVTTDAKVLKTMLEKDGLSSTNPFGN